MKCQLDPKTSTFTPTGWNYYKTVQITRKELDAICWRLLIILVFSPRQQKTLACVTRNFSPYPSPLSALTNVLIPQCWPGHSGKTYTHTHTEPWPLYIGHVSIKHIWINHPRGASPPELSSMWPLPIHFTAALCGNQAWIIKVSSEQWSIHCGPCSQTARPYFSRNDIENTWVCFQTMHINVKYVRPNMSIIITVQAEAMSRLILQKCC